VSVTLDPELAAAGVLARADVTGAPVDPISLARLWPGLRIRVADLDGAGYLVDLDGRVGELLLRASDPPRRRRYTCAHELGHWVLATTHADRQSEQATRTVVERWCDRFAAALLMPRDLVIEDLAASSLAIEVIAGLPRRFDVSSQAALLRASEVAPIEVGIATVSADGVRLGWTTARDDNGRFDWIERAWLGHRLRGVSARGKWSGDGLEVQALHLGRARWLLTVTASQAALSWREASLAQRPRIDNDGFYDRLVAPARPPRKV
jgi:hypothetical protein